MERPDSVLAFSGALDTSRYPEMVERFNRAVEGSRVIVDLTAATKLEPPFMGELLLFNRRMQKEGRTVAIIARGAIARTLVIAGIDKRIPIVADPDAFTLLA